MALAGEILRQLSRRLVEHGVASHRDALVLRVLTWQCHGDQPAIVRHEL
jgi:hypothetical protein